MAVTREVVISDNNFKAFIDTKEKIVTLTRNDDESCQIDLDEEFVEAIVKEWNSEIK